MRPAGIGLNLIGHLQPWINPLPEQWYDVRRHLIEAGDVAERLAESEEAAIRIPDAGGAVDIKGGAEAAAARIRRGEQDVRVRIAEISVDTLAGTDDVLSVSAEINRAYDPRLKVVLVVLRRESKPIEDGGDRRGEGVEDARPGGVLNKQEIRILRLVKIQPVNDVVAETEVQRDAAAHAPVVLNVRAVLPVRDVGDGISIADGDVPNRTVEIVGQLRVEHRALPGVKGDKKVRLVHEIHARFEIVPEAAVSGHVPREIVAELELALLGGLRRVDVRAGRHAVGKGPIR